MRRLLRRAGAVLLVLVAAITLAAVGYDLATRGDSKPARELYAGPFVDVDGTLVAYRRWGTSGTPIVLLGGAAEPSWVWHLAGPLLAAHHVVYALDLPPFGYTERRGPYTAAGWTNLVRGFDRKLGIHRPLVVGHSLGAGVAALLALDHPREVSGIVLLDGDALSFGGGRGFMSHLLVYPYFPALLRLVTGSDWLISRVLANAWGAGHPPFDHQLLAEFERPFRVDGTGAALKQLVGGGIPGVTLADLGRVRVPRAVVWGANDNVDSLAAGRASAKALHVGVVVVPRAGHLSMLANPRATAAAILGVKESRRGP